VTILHVRLFGGVSLSCGDRVLPAIPSRIARSLFAYLITYRDRPHTRDLLAGTFWPNLPDAQARRRLTQALWQIKSVLKANSTPHPYLLTESGAVQFNRAAAYWLDTAEFSTAYQESRQPPLRDEFGRLRTAAQLYQGDFLAGYYDDWAVVERERLREMALIVLDRLVVLCKSQGAYQTALTYVQRLITEDPLSEERHREAIQLFHLLGRDRDAIQQYEVCRSILAEEMGTVPSKATQALFEEIATRSADEIGPYLPAKQKPMPSPLLEGSGQIPMVGRERQRALLIRNLEQAAKGQGQMILVEGETGVGKSRLLQEIAQDAEWRGIQIAKGYGREIGDLPPYGILEQVLRTTLSPHRARLVAMNVDRAWLGEVSRLVPALAGWVPDLPPPMTTGPDLAQSRFWEGLTQVVHALGEIVPLLLILEDLHWADEASLKALTYLVPRLTDSRVLLLGTCRSEDAQDRPVVWEQLQALEWSEGYQRLKLARLTEPETANLVQQMLGLTTHAPHFEARLYKETEGNPLFVLETLHALHDEGLLYQDPAGNWNTPWDETTTDYGELPLPSGIYHVIVRRLARLGPAERRVLSAAAILGEEITLDVLAEVCGLSGAECLTAVGELLHRKLWEESSAGYRFSHARIRQVAYEETEPVERRRLHHRAGEALERRAPNRVQALAYYFEQGQAWQKAMHYHRLAGERELVAHNYTTACYHLNAAIALAERTDLPDAERFDLLSEREKILDVLGERDAQAADQEAMEALARDNPARLAHVHMRQGWMHTHTGHFDQGRSAARQALALFQQEGNVPGQVAALSLLGTLLDWYGKSVEAIAPLRDAIALGQSISDRRSEAKAHQALGGALVGAKMYAEATVHLKAALDRYHELNDPLGQVEALNRLGIAAMEQEHLPEAVAFYQESLAICRKIRYLYGEARALLNLGNILVFQGQTGQALEHYREAQNIFHDIRSERGEALVRLNIASELATILGDDVTAQTEAEAALAFYHRANDLIGEGQSLSLLGLVFYRRGELDQARRYLESGLEKLVTGDEQWLLVQTYRMLALVLLDQGNPEESRRAIEEGERICDALGLKEFAVTFRALRGKVLAAQGETEAACRVIGEAVAGLRTGILEAYLLPFWHYQLLDALGRRDEAHAALKQAYDILQKTLQGLSPAQQQMSMERVVAHRAIASAWEGTQRYVRRRLPRVDVPAGRAPRADEWIEVIWTLDSPDDQGVPGKVVRRRQRLLRLLQQATEQGAAPTVRDLADALSAGQATIKRDLAALRAAGHNVYTRGTQRTRQQKRQSPRLLTPEK